MSAPTVNEHVSQNGEEIQSDAIVISGMAGRFPNSDDVQEFRDKLFNKVDLVSDDERRWAATHAEIPQRTGKVNLVEKFDAGFFGVHQKQAHTMDPMCRMLLERTFEAVLDAGINPKELRGTDTGVFIGSCFSESEKTSFYDSLYPEKYGIMGCTRSMLAKRVSYWFQLEGKSYITDTACSSSLFALEHAYRAVKEGNCNMAIVGGCNLCLHPIVSLQFARLGVLSLDGACKSFDDAANGYARSEGIAVVILQKYKDSRRVYAEIIHSKTNCDGYKEQGITYPSGKVQKVLLEDFYQECGVNPAGLTYVEAHGTGTRVGDPEELGTLDEIFCTNRETPLLIGSVKSNIGHNEPTSGLCSVVKVVLAFETGFIPPNINYSSPRHGVEALETGRMKVVSEKTPLPDDKGLIGVNSFGFGGANSHLLLRWNKKEKTHCRDSLPRLICLSGRTADSLNYLMEQVQERFDHELLGLLHKAFQSTIPGHFYRGFLVVTKEGTLMKSCTKNSGDTKPLKLIFGNLQDHLKIGKYLFNIPMFAAHVKKAQNYIKGNSLFGATQTLLNSNIGCFILLSGIYQILKELDIKPDVISGLNIPGTLCAKYAKGLLSLEECLQKLLSKSEFFEESELPCKDNTYAEFIIGQSDDDKERYMPLINLEADSIMGFLQGLGNFYQHGYDPILENLYPKIHWPVGRGTPMISPLIKWDHSKNWFVMVYQSEHKTKSGQRFIELSSRDDEWTFLKGHVIDGRVLFPATGYLVLIWETLARVVGKLTTDMKIVFEDVKFMRACTVPTKGEVKLGLNIRKGSGYFEIIEGESPVVTGRIYEDLEMINEWEALSTAQTPTSDFSNLSERDVYKELRLRGYNYKDDFRALKICSLDTTVGKITWTGNWIPLMDCMLQMQILSEDTRNLYVPTRISKIMIDSAKHINTAKSFIKNPDEHPNVPVYFYKDLNIIRCGGIEVRGLSANAIAKRSQPEPVLETYKFIPYKTSHPQTIDDIIRNFVQVALENEPIVNLKSVEVLEDKPLKGDMVCLSGYLKQALEDQPVVKAQLTVLTNLNIEPGFGITIEDKKVTMETDCYFVVVQNFTKDMHLVRKLGYVLKSKGFVISLEDSTTDKDLNVDDFTLISSHQTDRQKWVMYQKFAPQIKRNQVIEVTDLTWFDPLQEVLKSDDNIILWSADPQSGILGLVNCLRREPSMSDKVSCFWFPQASKDFTFSLDDPNIKKQMNQNLGINIYMENEWGSYRHLKLKESSSQVEVEHCYVNVTNRGDLSSLRWIEGPLKHTTEFQPEQTLVRVCCASVNFRDIMTATGRIQPDVITRNRLEQECVQGFEFSGITSDGLRVLGMLTRNAMATLVPADVNLIWKMPEDWSMQEAATVPAVYGTVLYGLIVRAGLRRGESILIHSGTGGVGHAAIHVASHYGCQIFVTVGTEDKKRYIKKNFPQIKDEHVGNSRDLSFLQMVLKYTNNEGVDLVLNSLADEKLQASVKCLKRGGRFIEIGKYDLAADSRLSLDLIKMEAVYHGVMLDGLFETDPIVKRSIYGLLQDGIDMKFVKPLPMTCFKRDQLEEAFRYMATGKHTGKVVIEVRPIEPTLEKSETEKFQALSRFYCSSEKTYIVNGGLGGFGLELIDWLVLRGARHIVVNSRRHFTSAYQKLRLNTWKTYGAIVEVLKQNLITLEGCRTLLSRVDRPVAGIFNLAVVLKDSIFENQTIDNFKVVLDPKAAATINLDVISRELCPELEHFVVFSSVSCGRGNAGQTNYGLANSIMERVCEQRCRDGLPGLAIQWGAIGDVGLVADMQEENTEIVIGGTLQQKISSCLNTLDRFLRMPDPIVASMVVAEKKTGSSGAGNIVDAVVGILGLRDLKTVSLHSTFPELGMDSMMAVEIKQTLEREYDVFLSPQDIRAMSFSRLQEIAVQKTSDLQKVKEDLPKGVKVLLRYIAEESQANIPLVQLVQGVFDENDTEKVKLFFLPGIEGMATLFDPMVKHLSVSTMCMQYCYSNPEDTIQEMAQTQVKSIKGLIRSEFCIAAHSFGSAVALEVVAQLEKLGFKGTLILLDGAPSLMKELIRNQLIVSTEAEFQTSLLCTVMSVYLPFDVIAKQKNQMLQCETYDQRIDTALTVTAKELPHRPEYMKIVCYAAFKRMKAIYEYQPSFGTLKSKVVLFRPSNSSILDIEMDYGLSTMVGSDVQVKFYEGNHVSILENVDMIQDIEKIAMLCGQRPITYKLEETGKTTGLIPVPENLRNHGIS